MQEEYQRGSLISFMSNKVKSSGGLNLAQGIPAFEPPVELIQLLKQVSEEPVHQYAPGTGNSVLLEQLENHYRAFGLKRSDFLIVNGATEAISLIFLYLKNKLAGQLSVLAFDPVYESYKNLARIFQVPFYPFYQTDSGEIDFVQLEQELVKNKIKLIFVASPGNPLGKIWPEAEVDQLVDLAEKHQIYIVFDAVYSDLYFDECPYLPLKRISPYLFFVTAFSKKLSITGWRLGYLIAHQSHMPELMDIHDFTGLSSPSVLQEAVAWYLSKYNFGLDYNEELRSKLKTNYFQLSDSLTQMGFQVNPAQGGYFIWCKLPDSFHDGFRFAMELYENQKVAVVPGIHFSDKGQKYIRINIARHPYEISMAVEKIKKFVLASR